MAVGPALGLQRKNSNDFMQILYNLQLNIIRINLGKSTMYKILHIIFY